MEPDDEEMMISIHHRLGRTQQSTWQLSLSSAVIKGYHRQEQPIGSRASFNPSLATAAPVSIVDGPLPRQDLLP